MGAGQKPVFLFEYGVGGLFDAVTALAEATFYRTSAGGEGAQFPEAPNVAYVRSMAERVLAASERLGMDRVYCFPRARSPMASSTSPSIAGPPSTSFGPTGTSRGTAHRHA